MKAHLHRIVFAAALLGSAVLSQGCNRQTRGNADATGQSRAATPAEGGATSTTGSAGKLENFGDTRTKTEKDGRSPSASPTGKSQDAQPGKAPPNASGGAVTPTNTGK